MPLAPGTRLGPYEVTSQIGVGGMGEVYQATDTKLKRQVAIKVLPESVAADKDRLARFQREAEVLASLNHPHIAAIYGIEEIASSASSDGLLAMTKGVGTGASRALVMELVEGEDLSSHIARGPIAVGEALPIARQIAEALEAAHEQGIIHRDLKPGNIKITPDGRVKVLDFGLAKAMGLRQAQPPGVTGAELVEASPTLTHQGTLAGMIIGTAAYMSPEQAKGKPVDKRADIWAFGVVLYEMLTGRRLFAAEDVSETLAAVLTRQVSLNALPPGTPLRLRALVGECLIRDSKQRLRDIGHARIEIARIEAGTPDSTTATPTASAPAGSGRSRALAALAATLGLALVAGALLWAPWRAAPTAPAPPPGRFSIQLPGLSRFSYLTLSPDGTMLAFMAVEDGTERIWIRPLDGLEARPLAGTEGASYPFWSPDSRKLGFFSRGRLRRIGTDGGPVDDLSEAGTARGGSWNRDGIILFSPTAAGGLFQIPEAGGAPTPVTQAKPGLGHRYPRFIASGRHFLFVVAGDVQTEAGVYAGSLDGRAPVRLLQGISNAQDVPPTAGSGPGLLLFTRQAAAMAVSFDAETLRVSGEARVIAQGVGHSGNLGFFALTASDNGVLVHHGGAPRNFAIASFDRAGRQVALLSAPRAFTSFDLSRDGRQVCFTVIGDVPSAEQRAGALWVQTLDGVTPVKLGSGDGCVFSPDGKDLVYNEQGLRGRFLRKRVNSTQADEVLFQPNLGANNTPLDISPDGRGLVYSQTGSHGHGLWLLPLDGKQTPVKYFDSPIEDQQAQFSPDGKWLAYSSNTSGQFEVYVQPLPSTGAPQQISNSGGTAPRWRQDGKELYYLSAEGRLMAVPVTLGAGTLGRGSPQQLSERSFLVDSPLRGLGPRALYKPSADGKTFFALIPAEGLDQDMNQVIVRTNWRIEVDR